MEMLNLQKNEEKMTEEKVSELLSVLEKVNFEMKKSEEQTNTHPDMYSKKSGKDNTIDLTSQKYLKKQNILHPTTKTLTPLPQHTKRDH